MKESTQIIQEQRNLQRLSPQQVQYVRLLEMNGAEIEDEVRRQLDDNPALEGVDANNEQPAADADEIVPVAEVDPDDDPADYMPYDQSRAAESFTPQVADDNDGLYEYLLSQLGEIDTDELSFQIAQYIIGNIDDNGYLSRSYSAMADDIALATGYDVTRDDVVRMAQVVRDLDPAGIAAIDLRDCLILQLRRVKPVTLASRIALEIVENYFDLFSKKHFDRLLAQLGVSKDNLNDAIRLIQSMNPKPGSSITGGKSSNKLNHVTPDVAVEYEDGRFSVYIISSLPQLQIEASFRVDDADANIAAHKNVQSHEAARQAEAFIKQKRDEAEGFISALQQRTNTLLAVTKAIVGLQSDFFVTGDRSLIKPMILKDVASITGFDISVVSRATSGKYVLTNTGIYPLKMFFNEAPKVDSDTSSHQIQHVLNEIIEGEDKRHPFSDDALCRMMAQRGFDIARRTITKYRERMGIPAARLRKTI